MNWSNYLSILLCLSVLSCSNSNNENLSNSTPVETEVDTLKQVVEPTIISEKKEQAKDNVQEKPIVAVEQTPKADSINRIIHSIAGLEGYKAFTFYESFALKGDFYGDGIDDLALLIEKDDKVNLCVINYTDTIDYYIFGDNDNYDDYRWAGVFEKVEAGETLWSNYIDDFRSLDDVPENEKVILDYDAIYAHASESCGGGFIFWKNGKFNWLQQE